MHALDLSPGEHGDAEGQRHTACRCACAGKLHWCHKPVPRAAGAPIPCQQAHQPRQPQVWQPIPAACKLLRNLRGPCSNLQRPCIAAPQQIVAQWLQQL